MGDIKSAWEIAQEKADKLGTLSPQERQKQHESKCRVIGESLAEQYLGGQDTKYLEAQLNKQDNQDRKLISQMALHRLAQELDLNDSSLLDKLAQGIVTLAQTDIAAQVMSKIKELSLEYLEAEQRERQQIEKASKEMLHQLRISGSSVKQINLRAKEEWQEKLDKLGHPFEERLMALKQELLAI